MNLFKTTLLAAFVVLAASCTQKDKKTGAISLDTLAATIEQMPGRRLDFRARILHGCMRTRLGTYHPRGRGHRKCHQCHCRPRTQIIRRRAEIPVRNGSRNTLRAACGQHVPEQLGEPARRESERPGRQPRSRRRTKRTNRMAQGFYCQPICTDRQELLEQLHDYNLRL